MQEKTIDYSSFNSRIEEKESRKILGDISKQLGVQKSTLELMLAKFLEKKVLEEKVDVDIIKRIIDIK